MQLTPSPDHWADTFFDEGFEETFAALGKYDTTAQDLAALTALPALRPGARILDVPCGAGRHAGPLAAAGYRVTGIDSAPVQLANARRLWPTVDFHPLDMRTPPPGPYDVVLNLWTSFGYLPTPADDADALTAWRRVLAPGGTLVMELTTRERAEHENRHAGEAISTKTAVVGTVTETSWYDWTESLAHVTYSRPGWSRTCRTRMYTRAQLHTMLTAAGFTRIAFHGDFRLGPPAPANRTVVIATTPGATP
ncbi:class I SAM-dependent methyltransferase [Streptomyces sp. NPDC006510]|uniref:class I SAM-dependent methyltransferase n=1 Tax=Streptomyces sp. NPDC006510 TaxID=3155600 RepID=UPI0033A18FEC